MRRWCLWQDELVLNIWVNPGFEAGAPSWGVIALSPRVSYSRVVRLEKVGVLRPNGVSQLTRCVLSLPTISFQRIPSFLETEVSGEANAKFSSLTNLVKDTTLLQVVWTAPQGRSVRHCTPVMVFCQ